MANNSIESKILELEHLLVPYQSIWQNEVLPNYLLNGLTQNQTLTFEELKFFDQWGFLPEKHPLHKLSLDLQYACTLPDLTSTSESHNFGKGISAKKNHEIHHLLEFMKKNNLLAPHDSLVDLAGGLGLLSGCVVSNLSEFALERKIIDHNLSFKEYTEPAPNFSFHHYNLLGPLENLPITTKDHLFILHGCGNLSDQSSAIFNRYSSKSLCMVGCCYHLCTSPIHFLHYSPLQLSKETLHLATKTHRIVDEKAWKKRLSQKHYRYALECWYHQNYTHPMPSLRSSPTTLYQKDFLTYAKEQLKRLKITESTTIFQALQHEFDRGFDLRSKLIGMGALRLIFARPIEVYLSLRRAMELKNTGKKNLEIIIGEIFSRNISPRNILIFARRS